MQGRVGAQGPRGARYSTIVNSTTGSQHVAVRVKKCSGAASPREFQTHSVHLIILRVHIWWVQPFHLFSVALPDLKVASRCSHPRRNNVHPFAMPLAVMPREKSEKAALQREPVEKFTRFDNGHRLQMPLRLFPCSQPDSLIRGQRVAAASKAGGTEPGLFQRTHRGRGYDRRPVCPPTVCCGLRLEPSSLLNRLPLVSRGLLCFQALESTTACRKRTRQENFSTCRETQKIFSQALRSSSSVGVTPS